MSAKNRLENKKIRREQRAEHKKNVPPPLYILKDKKSDERTKWLQERNLIGNIPSNPNLVI